MNVTTNQAPVLTVSQLTNAIKLSLEGTFPSIWLQGEVSNCKLQSSGHLYFSLKDSQAQISAVMFRGDVVMMKVVPKEGSHVIVYGALNVYPPSGKYQLIVREMKLMGLGELLLKLEELKIKLHKKGWFKAEHKKSLPKFPKVIGVVTSPTGAAIQDILNVLTRRFSGFKLILNPVKVQGDGAAQEIAQAITQFNLYNMVDVMIVGRGGGSIEDLWAFNEEIVAEAIFFSKIPIISAVGHETDHCISDYVADVRAPTPSAAAELVIAEKAQQLTHLKQASRRIQQTVFHLLRHHRNTLIGILKQPILNTPYVLLGFWMQKLDNIKLEIDKTISRQLATKRLIIDSCRKQLEVLKPVTQIIHLKIKLSQLERSLKLTLLMKIASLRKQLNQKNDQISHSWRLHHGNRRKMFSQIIKQKQLSLAWERYFLIKKEKLKQLASSLKAIDPKILLTKGYSILFSEKDHSVISSVHAIQTHQNVKVLLSDGEILTTVKEILIK
jgi:exodeoxyribonuclease VII large subunit